MTLVALPTTASSGSQALPYPASCSSGALDSTTGTRGTSVAWPAQAHGRPVGTASSASATSEACDGSPGCRSSFGGGRDRVSDANRMLLACPPRAVRTLADDREPLSALVPGGAVGTHSSDLASARGTNHFLCLRYVSVTVVLELRFFDVAISGMV